MCHIGQYISGLDIGDGGKLKAPRPVSEKQKKGAVEELKKNYHPWQKPAAGQIETFLNEWKNIPFGSQDESRMGYTQFKEGN
ncbi:hypothetical protein QUA43_26095 [Microcoleus sp. N9_B4]|uniref:hypothetical protein n=1 Tax=Microcoleus sp. N9_B4 TaxID=3055386 RepID=UPI002FCF9DC5